MAKLWPSPQKNKQNLFFVLPRPVTTTCRQPISINTLPAITLLITPIFNSQRKKHHLRGFFFLEKSALSSTRKAREFGLFYALEMLKFCVRKTEQIETRKRVSLSFSNTFQVLLNRARNASRKNIGCFGCKYSMFWVKTSYISNQDIGYLGAKYPMFF